MTVLITGGSGFVGSWMTRELLSRGEQVVLYDLYPRTDLIYDFLDQVTMVKGDLLDLGNLADTMKSHSVDRVIHAASYLGFESQTRPPLAVKVNCEGTANVLEASRIMDVRRVVYTSTQSVYGVTPPGQPVTEDDAPNPTTVYGATKRMCEWLGINYSTNYDMEFIAVRFPTVYGPTKLGRGWTVPLMDVVENPVAGLPAVIASGGDVRQELLYVKDAARTVVNAAFVEATEHQIFNLGSSTAHTMHEMAEVVRDRIPGAEIEIGDGPDPLYGLGGRLDLTRASAEIGHEITFTLEEGIDDWINFLRSRPQSENVGGRAGLSTISTDIPTIR